MYTLERRVYHRIKGWAQNRFHPTNDYERGFIAAKSELLEFFRAAEAEEQRK